MIGLDTNVLVRYLTQDDVEQAALAVGLIEKQCTREQPCFINHIVLCEIVWVLGRAYGYPRDSIANVLERILRTAQFQIEDLPVAWTALRAYRQEKADFADGLIGSLNRQLGCEYTVTLDQRAARLGSFKLLGDHRHPSG